MQRDTGIDVIKGICILLVVVCHTLTFEYFPELVGTMAEAIFLNCFFAASGYLIAGKPMEMPAEKIKKRFFGLLRPYIVFSILTILWHAILWYGFRCTEISTVYLGKELLLRDAAVTVLGMGIGTLWFLPVLFVTYAMLIGTLLILEKISASEKTVLTPKADSDKKSTSDLKRQRKLLELLVLAIIALLFFLLNFKFEMLADLGGVNMTADGNLWMTAFYKYCNTLSRICYGYAFSLFGYLIGRGAKMSWRYFFAGTIVFAAIAIITAVIGMSGTWLFTIGSSLCFFYAVLWLSQMIKKLGGPYPIGRALAWCGKMSLDITVIHYLFVRPVEAMIVNRYWTDAYDARYGMLLLAINLPVTILLAALLNHSNRYRRMMGRVPIQR